MTYKDWSYRIRQITDCPPNTDCFHSGVRNGIYVSIRRLINFSTHFAFSIAVVRSKTPKEMWVHPSEGLPAMVSNAMTPAFAKEHVLSEVYETSEDGEFEPHKCWSEDEMHIEAVLNAMEDPRLAPTLAGIGWAAPVMEELLK